MIPDPLEKTVLIPIKIVKGEIQFFYGGKLPELKDGIIGELTVPSYSITDKKKLILLSRETNKVFIPGSTHLMVQISPKGQDIRKPGIVKYKTYSYGNASFVEIILKENLNIKLRSTKKGELDDCKCCIPAMPEQEAKSVNHAYTIISQHYETHRRSHSGNVFDKVYLWNNKKIVMPLKNLRDEFESEYERELIVLNKTWYYKVSPAIPKFIWSIIIQKNEKEYNIYCINQDSDITKDIPFKQEYDAHGWLIDNRYNELDIEIISEEFMPPNPPYKTANGEVIIESVHLM